MKKLIRKKRVVKSNNPIHTIMSNRELCCTTCEPWERCSITPWWWHQGSGNEDIHNSCVCVSTSNAYDRGSR